MEGLFSFVYYFKHKVRQNYKKKFNSLDLLQFIKDLKSKCVLVVSGSRNKEVRGDCDNKQKKSTSIHKKKIIYKALADLHCRRASLNPSHNDKSDCCWAH